MNNYLAQVPINGFELERGSYGGLELTYEWLQGQLQLGGIMVENEVISQVNVTDESIILFIKENECIKDKQSN